MAVCQPAARIDPIDAMQVRSQHEWRDYFVSFVTDRHQ